jgi:hypothetical protein
MILQGQIAIRPYMVNFINAALNTSVTELPLHYPD